MRKETVAATCMMVGSVVGAYWTGRASAEGIPATHALTYSGLLTDTNGGPISGAKSFVVQMWDKEIGGNMKCTVGPQTVSLVAGSFAIPMPNECTTAVHALPDLWTEIFVDGILLGTRTKLGATPYAVEADHAVSATSATNAVNATNATNATAAMPGSSLAQMLTDVTTRLSALEAKKTFAGNEYITQGSCPTVDTPCNIDISPAGFRAVPVCTLTMLNHDATGYTEHMVVKAVTTTTLSIWKGQYYTSGTTMNVFYICTGT
jgi:hypothetical protein